MNNQPALSIVIPVGPHETEHMQLLQCLSGFLTGGFQETCEIVVSGCEPGQSEPPSTLLGSIDCIHVTGPPGRAAQLNRGVAASSGRCLWLLHADSRPAPGTMACSAAFARSCHGTGSASVLGWFPLSFAPDGPPLAVLNAAGANLRSRIFRLPFGDQAWLMSRDTFDALGGFDEQFGLGEDLDFIRRARRAGIRLCRQSEMIATSGRRYRKHGWLRTTLAHLWLTPCLWVKSAQRSRRPVN
ncbi:MAG TPA: glycosyltransferase [Wenzhouxiangellaceae bacterium]|nr:glycosyltransferase [Wenzhouxiangellaceae bacterium]